MNNEIKQIKIKTIGQLLDFVETEQKAKELIDYITNLQEENERLTNELNTCMIERNNFLSRIVKAIEYIKSINKRMYKDDYGTFFSTEDLLNILKGKDK